MLVAGHLQFISFVQFTWFAMERHGEWDATIPDGARLGELYTLSFDFEFFFAHRWLRRIPCGMHWSGENVLRRQSSDREIEIIHWTGDYYIFTQNKESEIII